VWLGIVLSNEMLASMLPPIRLANHDAADVRLEPWLWPWQMIGSTESSAHLEIAGDTSHAPFQMQEGDENVVQVPLRNTRERRECSKGRV
jgi:hypothetical protein